MIWGIHYFTTKLKTKIDVIPRGCFKWLKMGNLFNLRPNIYNSAFLNTISYIPNNCNYLLIKKIKNDYSHAGA